MTIDINDLDDTSFEELEAKAKNFDRGDKLAGEDDKKEVESKEKEDDTEDKKVEEKEDKASEDKDLAEEIDEELEAVEKAARDKREAKKNEGNIPKSRFDKALNAARQREEALKARLEELEAKQAKEKPDVFAQLKSQKVELEDKYEELLLDGKKEEARSVRRQLNEISDRLDGLKSEASAKIAQREALEAARYDAAVARAETRYPILNPDSDDYDPETEREVVELMRTLARGGVSQAEALERSVKYILGSPKSTDTLRDEHKAAEDLKAQRAEQARRKGAEAAKRQPPDTTDVGLDSNKAGKQKASNIDLNRLSQEQFAKLDEDTVRRLRGDFLEA